MQGSAIRMMGEPLGMFLEGTVVGTPFPGTVGQVAAGVAPISGDFSWGIYNPTADADPRIIAVFIEDSDQGFPYNIAYTSGTHCFLYVPANGEFLNMLMTAAAGTGGANIYTVGERLGVKAGTGLVYAGAPSAGASTPVASGTMSPFMCMEAITVPAGQAGWVWCMRTYQG